MSKAPIQDPVDRDHDLFEDPAIARTLDEDPIARFFMSNWKVLLTVLVAAVAFVYFRNQLRITSEIRQAESSETFEKARKSFAELQGDDQAANENSTEQKEKDGEGSKTNDMEKLRLSAKDSFAALKSGPQPYAEISKLYEQLMLNSADSVQQISALSDLKWRETKDPAKRLVLELQALAYARKLLDQPEQFPKALEILKDLSKDAINVRAPAVLTLLRVVDSPEDKAKALALGQDALAAFPEQSEKIESELKRLQ